MTRKRRVPAAVAAAGAAALLAAGCGGGGGGSGGGHGGQAHMVGAVTTSRTHTVPLDVVHGKSNSTLALVPITIDGKGPFRFALDTGAAQSLVDTSIARRLHLKTTGKVEHLKGVVSATNAVQVRIGRWRAGNVRLPAQNIVATQLGGGLQGLLGSDVLHLYDRITIDYAHQRLVLHPRSDGTGGG